jgi:hypothetical protein
MPSDLTGVRERVGNALAGTDADARFRCDSEWVCADDLRALLLALDAAEAEREEIVFYLHSASSLSAARAHVDRIIARTTPTENPDV